MTVYCLWSSGYSVSSSLAVSIVKESDKAIQFQVLDNEKCLFWLPKKAVKFDTKTEGVINLASWFAKDSFLASMFNRYGNHYKR
jgi:hypothetical protein